MAALPNEEEVFDRLQNLVSVYPFKEYEYLISTLLAMDVLSLDDYYQLRDEYISRNLYLYGSDWERSRFWGRFSSIRRRRI